MIVPRPLKKVREKITPFSQEDKIPTFNLGSGTADSTTVLHGDGTWQPETNLSGYVPYTGATSDVDLGEHELKAGQVEFDQSPTGTAGVAVMRWNNTDGTVDIGLKGGNVTLQVGQEQVARVVNKATVDLLEANYQAVKVSGATGQRLSVNLAKADNDFNSASTIGLVTETILKNQEGFITTSGQVKEINTTGSLQGETWADGDILYLSPTTAGNITNVKPVAPQHLIIVGYVEYAHINHGKIFVKVDNGYELNELHNVLISAPTNDQVLQFELSTSLWKNKTLSTGLTVGTTAISSGTDGRILFQNGGGILQQSANFFWDNTNSRLGIGNSSPTARLHISAQGALSSDIALKVRNSANTADLFSVLGNGVTNVSTLTASNVINIAQGAGLYYPQLSFSNNGGASQGFIRGYNGKLGTSSILVEAGNTLNVNFGFFDANYAQLQIKAKDALAASNSFGILDSALTTYLLRVQNNGAIGIGTTTTLITSAKVQIDSTTQGFLPPRMTNAQRLLISTPAVGLMVYCTDATEGLYIYKSTGWVFVI